MQPLFIFSSVNVSKVPQPGQAPSQGTKDSLNVRSTVRVCTLLVPWPWFCWAARHNKATSHSPSDQWRFFNFDFDSDSDSHWCLEKAPLHLLRILSTYMVWSPSKIGKLTFNMQRSSLMGRFWRIFAVSKCRYNLFRCLDAYDTKIK